MATTSIRLPAELKARIERLATGAGETSHAFMVNALSRAADMLERQQTFDAEVERRAAKFDRRREVITFDEFRQYATALAAGRKPTRPKPRKLAAVLAESVKSR